ncbi:ABC transporter permease [Bacillus sp. V3-13]|uniref:ABC transporter permease n=1 Tax=Bacillus sp. V3-13 TaxID=2053728 RepID=UPI000C75ECE5|nr:ABC transporter permease [Bacillus sp. V3-13]PLR77974.1 ABC transporter permease [Bacillus sp. V3-13]
MFNGARLWKQRFSRRSKEMGRYLRYIFNGHLVIVMLFLLGTAAYYYQAWVKTLPASYPVPTIIAVLLGILLTYSPIYTFLFEADKIFLLPLETKLADYFKRSILASFAVQTYLLILVLAAVMPMYVQVNEGEFSSYFTFLLILLAVKGLNLFARWKVQYYVETSAHWIDSAIRFSLNAVFVYMLFSGAGFLFLIVIAGLMAGLYWYYRSQVVDKGLKWEYLIESEERRMTSFYRIANLFTDVPKFKDKVKRRKWLDWVLARLAFKQEQTYSHLYMRTFLRAGDYFGLFLRLFIIGAGVLYLISFGIGQVAVVLLFLYLTGFQLLPLWNHHQNKLWVQLYPVAEKYRSRSFKVLLSALLFIQNIAFCLVLMLKGDWLIGGVSFAAGIGFIYFFVSIYAKKRLEMV